MKPKHAHKKINDIFQKYHNGHSDIDMLINDLQKVKPELKRMLKLMSKDDTDSRRGQETYGFLNWKEDLIYISDRWSARFRIQWILDLLDYLLNEKYN